MKKICILYSGGLDSFTMYHLAKKDNPDCEVEIVYYRHGCESEEAEIALLPTEAKIMTVDWLGQYGITPVPKPGQENAGSFYIPGRNLVFATLAACQFMPDEIWLGPTIVETHPDAVDKNEVFRAKANDVLSYVLSPFKPNGVAVKYPLVERGWDKDDEIRWLHQEAGVSLKEIANLTSSCWHNTTGTQCGNCWMCLRRFFYFQKAVGECPDVHEQDLLSSECAKRIFHEYRSIPVETMNQDQLSFANCVFEYQKKHGLSLI